MEGDLAGGQPARRVVGVVELGVVPRAGADQVGQVGPAALGPGFEVVDVGDAAFAAVGDAAAVLLDDLDEALGVARQPSAAAEVEDLALTAAEDGGDDAGFAGELSGE